MSTNSKLDIIIVGAGIAGLSASISCALGGHTVTVLEGAKQLAEIGAGFQLTPNSTKILQRWGLRPVMEKTWTVPETCTVHRYSNGKVLAHAPKFAKQNQAKYGSPFVDIHRVDMQRILYDKALELGVKVRLSSRVASIEHDLPRPQINLLDGTSLSADLVVGADGLWSKCRESMAGSRDEPLPTGDLAYRIVLTLDQVEDEELRKMIAQPQLHFWIGPGAHAVAYSVRAGEMYNVVLLVPDNLPDNVARQNASIDEMKQIFAGWDPVLTRFLSCVKTVDKWKLMHRSEMQSWSNARHNFVLIGDSCHPMLPYLAQGANSSIEDGAVLGRILSYVKDKRDLPHAIQTFEKVRKSRGERVVRETFHQRHDFHMEDGPEQEERDKLFESQLGKDEPEVKFPSRWTCPVIQPWLYGYDADREADAAMQQSAHKGSDQVTATL